MAMIDIACVGSDVVTFSPQRTPTGFEMPADVSPRGRQERTIATDPVRHDLLWAMVGNVFSARRLMHQAERIRGVVVTCLEELAVRDVADLVGHIAQTVPAWVLGSLLGMPPADDQNSSTGPPCWRSSRSASSSDTVNARPRVRRPPNPAACANTHRRSRLGVSWSLRMI
jgi:cytochrome P450